MKVMMVYTYSELGNSALSVGQYYTHIKGTYLKIQICLSLSETSSDMW